MNRAPAVWSLLKDRDEPLSQPHGYLLKVRRVSSARWKGYFQIVPVIIGILLQGKYQQVIHRHPYRPSPVGVSPKKRGIAFCRLIVQSKFLPGYMNGIIIFMGFGDGTDAAGG